MRPATRLAQVYESAVCSAAHSPPHLPTPPTQITHRPDPFTSKASSFTYFTYTISVSRHKILCHVRMVALFLGFLEYL